MTAQLTLRAATADDVAALVALDAACFEVSERWTTAGWAAEVEAHDALSGRGASRVVLVAVLHDEVVGAVTLSRQFETVDLLRVMVDRAHRRQGMAERLVHEATWFMRDAERVLLEVRHDNAAALMLYARLGFRAIDRRDDYYGPGRHAVVMACDLPWEAHR